MNVPPPAPWGAGRRARVWINVVVQAAVLLALLVMVNLLARKFPQRFDLTSRRTYALSPFAEDLLRALPYDIDVWMSTNEYDTTDDKSLVPALSRTAELLKEFRHRTPRVRVHDISIRGGSAEQLFAQHWKTVLPCNLYILARLGEGRTNKKTLELRQLYEGNALSGEILAYRGEPVLVQAIRELGGVSKRIVYEVEGHQELLTADTRNLGILHRFLTANEGIEFRRLNPVAYRSVPVDCDVLMILAPAQPFQRQELELFREYLERGGSLLVALRPKVRTNLEELLQEYGLAVGENVVHDLRQFARPNMSNLFVNDFFVHEINRNMVNLTIVLPEACTVDPIEKRDPNWKIIPLVRSSPDSWEEKGPTGPGTSPRRDGDERGGPLNLVVAVEKKVEKPLDERHKSAKLVVWGSFRPFTDAVLAPMQVPVTEYLGYLTNHFRWLADRELMEVKAMPVSVKPLRITDESMHRVEWVVYGAFPAFGIALGLLAWFLRRK